MGGNVIGHHTLLSLADPSDMTSMHDTATAAHRFSSTLDLGPFTALQKKRVTAIVMITARREMEQPTIEMISRACLSASPIWALGKRNSFFSDSQGDKSQ